MPRVTDAFPSKFLKAADLHGKRVSVTIDSMAVETIGDDTRPVIYFRGKDKGLVLNKTNANMIAEIAGTDEMDDWANLPISLYATKVDYAGKRVDAIRVDYPAGTKPVPPPVTEDGADDSIPF
jgi:hypothetical protein